MVTFYLEATEAGTWTITGYGDEGQISLDTYFSLYSARMRLYELEDEGNVCLDQTR